MTRVFRNIVPAVLWLTLALPPDASALDGAPEPHYVTVGTTPRHEVWTHQSGWTYAGKLHAATDWPDSFESSAASSQKPRVTWDVHRPGAGDTLVGLDGRPVEVVALGLDPAPTIVYNLEIDGTWTYFVHGAWVHNNSCDGLGSIFERFLRWSAKSSEHVRLHNVNDLRKRIHGVFNDDGVYAVEEAWAMAQRMGLARDAKGGINIPMGRIIGWEGGYEGTRGSLDTIRLILSDSLEVITAYPVRP